MPPADTPTTDAIAQLQALSRANVGRMASDDEMIDGVCESAIEEIKRLRGWLSYINGNFNDHRECSYKALDGEPIPEDFTP